MLCRGSRERGIEKSLSGHRVFGGVRNRKVSENAGFKMQTSQEEPHPGTLRPLTLGTPERQQFQTGYLPAENIFQ